MSIRNIYVVLDILLCSQIYLLSFFNGKYTMLNYFLYLSCNTEYTTYSSEKYNEKNHYV